MPKFAELNSDQRVEKDNRQDRLFDSRLDGAWSGVSDRIDCSTKPWHGEERQGDRINGIWVHSHRSEGRGKGRHTTQGTNPDNAQQPSEP